MKAHVGIVTLPLLMALGAGGHIWRGDTIRSITAGE